MSLGKTRNQRKRSALIVLKGDYCVYCGELAEEGDHFPPRVTRNRVYVIPVCKRCNRVAGTNYPFNFAARADYVEKWLKIRKKWKVWNPVAYFLKIGGALNLDELFNENGENERDTNA